MRTPYRDIPTSLRGKTEFQGNSMSGKLTRAYRKAPDGSFVGPIFSVYAVWSYSTVVAILFEDGSKWISDNKWGPTSGRHINLCKENL